MERFENDIKDKNADKIVFAIGINDSILLPKEKRNYVDFEKFQENLKKLIGKARKFSKGIVFIGLTPADENLTMPTAWETEMHYTNEEILRYNDAIRQTCKNEKLKFIDLFAEFEKESYKGMLSDGLHPNAIGHAWMAKKISEKL